MNLLFFRQLQAAGSIGYAAPEILTNVGHGKPVDLWCVVASFFSFLSAATSLRSCSLFPHLFFQTCRSLGIITYVLLCGYSPFRSDDPNELMNETIRGRIEFHERYWKKPSQECKSSFTLSSRIRCDDFLFREPLVNSSSLPFLVSCSLLRPPFLLLRPQPKSSSNFSFRRILRNGRQLTRQRNILYVLHFPLHSRSRR